MKKVLTSLILVTMLTMVVSLGLTSAVFAVEQDVDDRIFDNLAPSAEVFGQDREVTPEEAQEVLAQGVADIIGVVLSILGIILIILIIYAGFMWMTAAGNEDRVSTAKKILVAAIIGLTIILSAYLITAFVIAQLIEATGANT